MVTREMGRFTVRVAFVTGAASGIGRAAAVAFARAGASVAVADVSEESNQETAASSSNKPVARSRCAVM